MKLFALFSEITKYFFNKKGTKPIAPFYIKVIYLLYQTPACRHKKYSKDDTH